MEVVDPNEHRNPRDIHGVPLSYTRVLVDGRSGYFGVVYDDNSHILHVTYTRAKSHLAMACRA